MRKSRVFRCTAVLLALLLVFGLFPVAAAAYYDHSTYEVSGREATLTYYGSDNPIADIPPTYTDATGTYPVTRIGNFAFFTRSSLTTVHFTPPSSVREIGENAFESCSALSDITIPASVKTIGNNAFSNCGSLLSMTVPDTVTSFGDAVFWGCSHLKSARLPAGMQSLNGTFAYCQDLTSVNIPASVTSMAGAFNGCMSLQSITLPANLSYIGSNAFMDCSSLKSISIPGQVYVIGDDAFRDCASLASVQLPGSLLFVNDRAFYGCSSLTEVIIPASVSSVGMVAFAECSSLKRAVFRGSMPVFANRYIFMGASSGFKVYYPVKYASSWSSYYDETKQAYCTATIYPQNSKASFQMMIDVNNGYITAPAAPVYAGHAFKGWFKDAACTKPWNFSTAVITSDISLYAKWENSTKYTLKLSVNKTAYGSVTGAGTYPMGTRVTIKAIPKAGYRFVRWLEGAGTLTRSYLYKFTLSKNRTFKAEFAVIGKPAIKSISAASGGRITLKWSAVTGVTGYYIYRSTKSGSGYTKIGSTSSLTFTDKRLVKGKTYYYKLQAYCTAGVTTKGAFSNVKYAKAK